MVLAEFHSRNCFGNWRLEHTSELLQIGHPAGPAIRSLGRWGQPDESLWHPDWRGRRVSQHSFVSGRPEWGEHHSIDADAEFHNWDSVAQGSHARLGWSATPNRKDATAATRLVEAFVEVNGQEPVEHGLARYRDAVAREGALGPHKQLLSAIFGRPGRTAADPEVVVAQVEAVLATLPEREAGVISMRFGLDGDDPRTLDDIARAYRLTRERARQIERKTMSKLRHPDRSQPLRELFAPDVE